MGCKFVGRGAGTGGEGRKLSQFDIHRIGPENAIFKGTENKLSAITEREATFVTTRLLF